MEIENIYTEYFSTVYKYLLSLTNDADIAEELTQETFCRALKSISSFQGNCKISTWLCQIAKHCWYELYRKRKKEISLDEIAEISLQNRFEEEFIEKEDSRKIYSLINQLDEKTKKVIIYRVFSNMNFKEIGDIMGKNENWARVTYFRGKNKIRGVGEMHE